MNLNITCHLLCSSLIVLNVILDRAINMSKSVTVAFSNHTIMDNWTIYCTLYILVARQQETHLIHAFNTYYFDIENIYLRGMFEMSGLLSYISISTWGTIKTNIYLPRFI